ncbi:MAG: SDR family NAD(P)-dependent oxidoreductase [Marmoricola sp.]
MTAPTVLVTGAGRGVGRASTLLLAAQGWNVLAGVRRAEGGEKLVADSTGRVEPVQLDVTNPDEVRAGGHRRRPSAGGPPLGHPRGDRGAGTDDTDLWRTAEAELDATVATLTRSTEPSTAPTSAECGG